MKVKLQHAYLNENVYYRNNFQKRLHVYIEKLKALLHSSAFQHSCTKEESIYSHSLRNAEGMSDSNCRNGSQGNQCQSLFPCLSHLLPRMLLLLVMKCSTATNRSCDFRISTLHSNTNMVVVQRQKPAEFAMRRDRHSLTIR